MKTNVLGRPLNFIGLITEGVRIFFYKWKEFIVISILVYLPILLFTVVSAPFARDIQSHRIDKLLSEIPSLFFLYLVFFLAQWLISILAVTSFAVLTEKIVTNKEITLAETFKIAASRWIPGLITSLLVAVIISILTLLFIIPGIIFGVYYLFWLPAVALREKSFKGALDYSKNLVQGQWWRIFGFILGIAVLVLIINLIISVPLRVVGGALFPSLLSAAIVVIIDSIFLVTELVLFLNTDSVRHHGSIGGRSSQNARRSAPKARKARAAVSKRPAARKTTRRR